MKRSILFVILTLFFFACNDDNDTTYDREAQGRIWLSGGLAYCAEQIHLDNGDTLIVNIDDVIAFKSGERVNVKFNEVGINEHCAPGIDCEIVEIERLK